MTRPLAAPSRWIVVLEIFEDFLRLFMYAGVVALPSFLFLLGPAWREMRIFEKSVFHNKAENARKVRKRTLATSTSELCYDALDLILFDMFVYCKK